MATHQTRLFASLVLDLMSDGQERTVTRIGSELGATSARVRWALTTLLSQRDIYICCYVANTHAKVYRISPIRTLDASQRLEPASSGAEDLNTDSAVSPLISESQSHFRYRSRGMWLRKADPSWTDEDRTLTAAMFSLVRMGHGSIDEGDDSPE
ncbi:hypothetical protein [Burkholderia cepacia]|uniref:hypothetical protein n=1 Tax=Burkholderia cepacia TaxID=292 RepID=UPI0015889808|nr:hypothetical protein [Burkholderia cepacia]